MQLYATLTLKFQTFYILYLKSKVYKAGETMIKKENIRIAAIIPRKVYKKLIKEAEYEDRSLSNMVCKILKERYNYKDDKEDE
ncbi:hypothetical protein BS101_12175 [Clostridium kluyveri]|uniref:CopG-like ribbon-helix-helix domain-containing protein n=2 Tax=Clostridium kluyveri TaxID=1534 RepID=A0A1L5F904_CLOKL|nr:hypothetical protein BS101_12175 [Clostridium kluyveri]